MPIYLNGVSDELGGAATLGDIPDVDLTGLAVNDGIMWDGAQWVPEGFVRRSGDTMTGQLILAAGTGNGLRIGSVAIDEYIPNLLRIVNSIGIEQRNSPTTRIGAWNNNQFSLIGNAGTNSFLNVQTGNDTHPAIYIGPNQSNVQSGLATNRLMFGSGVGAHDWEMERVGLNAVRLAAGDTLQIQQDPVLDNDLARKKYVDDEITAATGGTGFVVDTGDTMTGTLVFDTDNIGDATPVLRTIRTSTGFKGFTIDALGTLTWSNASGVAQHSISRLGSTSLRLSAGTQLAISQDPVDGTEASRKSYVDFQDYHSRHKYVVAAGSHPALGFRTVVVNVAGLVTIDLPSFPVSGNHVSIKRMSAPGAGNLVTINGNGRNIDGSATRTLNSQYSSITLEYSSEMDEWMIL